MANNFNRVIDHLILNESGSKNYRSPTSEGIWGYVNNPFDAGGATIHGVLFRTWKKFIEDNKDNDYFINNPRWEKFISLNEIGERFFDVHTFKLKDFKALTPADVKFFYKIDFWDKIKGDLLPAGIDYYVFDFSVHSGVSRAARYIQNEVGATQDGIIGENTLFKISEYIDKNGVRRLLKELDRSRRDFLTQIKNSVKFMKGWNKRLNVVMQKCYELIDDVYVISQKDITHSRTIKTSFNQAKLAAGGAAISVIAPESEKINDAIHVAVDNFESIKYLTKTIDYIYSYGNITLLIIIIGFAGYQIYLRYEDWFKGVR